MIFYIFHFNLQVVRLWMFIIKNKSSVSNTAIQNMTFVDIKTLFVVGWPVGVKGMTIHV